MRKIVILVSGGLDSSTVLAMQSQGNYEIHAISFNYAQNHAIELEKVKQFISNYNIASHHIIKLDLSAFNSSSLINKNLRVPKYRQNESIKAHIPNTYVPARNSIFLSHALGFAENIEATDIFIGAHKSDAANYPDCRPDYLEAFEKMANLATRTGRKAIKDAEPNLNASIKIHAPLINLTKSAIVAAGVKMGVDYAKTISCYNPDYLHRSCGICLACQMRLQAFADNKLTDPIEYSQK